MFSYLRNWRVVFFVHFSMEILQFKLSRRYICQPFKRSLSVVLFNISHLSYFFWIYDLWIFDSFSKSRRKRETVLIRFRYMSKKIEMKSLMKLWEILTSETIPIYLNFKRMLSHFRHLWIGENSCNLSKNQGKFWKFPKIRILHYRKLRLIFYFFSS